MYARVSKNSLGVRMNRSKKPFCQSWPRAPRWAFTLRLVEIFNSWTRGEILLPGEGKRRRCM